MLMDWINGILKGGGLIQFAIQYGPWIILALLVFFPNFRPKFFAFVDRIIPGRTTPPSASTVATQQAFVQTLLDGGMTKEQVVDFLVAKPAAKPAS